MKQIYLIMGERVQKAMPRYSEQIVSYLGKRLGCSPDSASTTRYVNVVKLESKTWREYFDTAMRCIDDSEFVVCLDVGIPMTKGTDELILENYCSLAKVKVNYITIDETSWQRILNDCPFQFCYSMLPDSDI